MYQRDPLKLKRHKKSNLQIVHYYDIYIYRIGPQIKGPSVY